GPDANAVTESPLKPSSSTGGRQRTKTRRVESSSGSVFCCASRISSFAVLFPLDGKTRHIARNKYVGRGHQSEFVHRQYPRPQTTYRPESFHDLGGSQERTQ